MRDVVAGNTLADLAVGVGDVVYYDCLSFDSRGDHLTITRASGNPDGTNTYYSDEHELAGNRPNWHVVSYADRPVRSMSQYLSKEEYLADNPVAIAGVQGYSSPTPDAVVFNISDNVYEIICQSEAWSSLVAAHLTVGTGMYHGVAKTAYSLPKSVYDEMYRRWPWIMHDQESIRILGTPESQNWRPARLFYLTPADFGQVGDLGIWHEVSAEDVGDEDYSYFNGHFFICSHNPPEDVETVKERLVEEKLKLLDSVMSRICAMTKSQMQQYGLHHDWNWWATMDKLP